MDEINVVVYDGSSVTSPKNWNNPKFGDPCYSLHTDSRNYVVYCFRPKTANCTEYTEDDKSATLTLGYHYGGGAMQR